MVLKTMNKTKKSIAYCLGCFFFVWSLVAEETGLEAAWKQTLAHNTSIIQEQIAAESAEVRSAGLEGAYAPGISAGYKRNSFSNNQIEAGVTQPLPGGMSLSVAGSASITPKSDPSLEITALVRQSLAPFWLHSDAGNPVRNSYRIASELQQAQLNIVQKEVLMEVTQQYVKALISLNELEQYDNSLSVLRAKRDALQTMYVMGSNSYTEVLALQNQIFTVERERNAACQVYVQYVTALEKLVGSSCVLTAELPEIPVLQNTFSFSNDFTQDALLLSCSEIINQQVQVKESTAPVIEFSYTRAASAWQFGVALDISNWLKENTGKTGLQLQNKRRGAEQALENHIREKQISRYQNESARELYQDQYDMLMPLMAEADLQLDDTRQLYLSGDISELDYMTLLSEVQNLKLTAENTRLLIWLYTFYLAGG